MRAHRAGLILVALAGVATACAGGGLSAEEWGQRDAICGQAQSDLAERERRGERVDSPRVVARYRSALIELEALDGSRDRTPDIDRLLAAIQGRVDVVEECSNGSRPPSH